MFKALPTIFANAVSGPSRRHNDDEEVKNLRLEMQNLKLEIENMQMKMEIEKSRRKEE